MLKSYVPNSAADAVHAFVNLPSNKRRGSVEPFWLLAQASVMPLTVGSGNMLYCIATCTEAIIRKASAAVPQGGMIDSAAAFELVEQLEDTARQIRRQLDKMGATNAR